MPTKTVVRQSRPIVIRQSAAKVAHHAKRAGSALAAAARDEKHSLTALLAAGALGYARRENMLDNVPGSSTPIGAEGVLALAAYAAGRFMNSKTASHVATGLGCVAVNRLAAGDMG